MLINNIYRSVVPAGLERPRVHYEVGFWKPHASAQELRDLSSIVRVSMIIWVMLIVSES